MAVENRCKFLVFGSLVDRIPDFVDRVSQLEHEATRRHNLDVHTTVKKNKPPPWQSKIDVSFLCLVAS